MTYTSIKEMNKRIKFDRMTLLEEAKQALTSNNESSILLMLNSIGAEVVELIKILNQDEKETKEDMQEIMETPDIDKTELDYKFLELANKEIEEIRYEKLISNSLLKYITISLRTQNYNGLPLIIASTFNMEIMRNLRAFKIEIEGISLACEESNIIVTEVVVDNEKINPIAKLNSEYRALKRTVDDDFQKIKRL